MVGKNMDHPLGEIGRQKNRRYPIEGTGRYRIGGDSTKLGGASSKQIYFYFIFYFRIRINQSIQYCHLMTKMGFPMLSPSAHLSLAFFLLHAGGAPSRQASTLVFRNARMLQAQDCLRFTENAVLSGWLHGAGGNNAEAARAGSTLPAGPATSNTRVLH